MSPGWKAQLALEFEAREARTVLQARRQYGPLQVQRPFYPEQDGTCHVYVLHPPAGIVGGDTLEISLRLASQARVLTTTPSATRWYLSRGRQARVTQQASLADGATLEWLPQENLLFNGAHARLSTRIDLRGDAQFCGWEMLGLGRPACAERFVDGSIDFRFELYRESRPVVLERLRSEDGCPPGLHGHAAYATFLATAADETTLAAARDVLHDATDTICGATLIDDVLIARGLAAHCEPLKKVFERLWTVVRPLVSRRIAVQPRIWHT